MNTNDNNKIISLALLVFIVLLAILFVRVRREHESNGANNSSDMSNQPQQISLSGNVLVSGNVPVGSTVVVMYRPTSAVSYMELQQTPAAPSIPFVIENAVDNQVYKIYAQLIDPTGNKIGESLAISPKAPASGLSIKLESGN